MKPFIKFLILAISMALLSGCASKCSSIAHKNKKLSDKYEGKTKADYSYQKISAPGKNEVPKSRVFQFDNAEVVGYLDNSPRQYIRDSDASSSKKESKNTESIDNELESLKKELDQQNDNPQPAEQKQVKSKRMVAYDGSINSRSSKPDSLITIAVTMVESCKGYVEMRNNNSVTLRIPVASFGIVYDSLLKLGQIIDFQRTAEDITDAFCDNDLRVKVLQKTIERYVKLTTGIRYL